jgi:hypothetical protein
MIGDPLRRISTLAYATAMLGAVIVSLVLAAGAVASGVTVGSKDPVLYRNILTSG